MTNKAEVYFALKGDDFDPDEITQRTGISPTKVIYKGDPRFKGRTYDFSMWMVSTGLVERDVLLVDELAEQLIESIEGVASAIGEAVKERNLYAVLEVVLHISLNDELSTPALGFSKKAIAFLQATQAEIDVDIYREWG